jgi:peroxiredoxin
MKMIVKLQIVAILILVSCNSNNKGFTIIGITSNIPDSTKIYLADFDSSYVISNRFQFKGIVDSLKEYTIYTKGFTDYKMLWIDNSRIIIDASKSTLKKAHVSGSRLQNVNSQYQDLDNYWRKKVDSINLIIRQTNKSDSILLKGILQIKDSIISNKQRAIIEFMRSNPDFYLGPFHITFLMFNQSKQITEDMFNTLNNIQKNNKWGKSVRLYLEKSVDLKVGDKVIDFTLPDINGNQFTLSSFKGKYVLLEFWASWCGPCRGENPSLLKMYRKYNTKGFEIVGVTLDEIKKDWATAIKSDTLIWTTISDLQGTLGEVPLTYKANYVPKNYLIDPSGIIVDTDVRGLSLEEKLNSLFKK